MEEGREGGSSREIKRQRDKEYRLRQKEKQREVKDKVEASWQQNQVLKEENELLNASNSLMNQTVQRNEQELEVLNAQFHQLNLHQTSKRVLLQALSHHLGSNYHLREENQILREENSELRSRIADGEVLQLVEEIAQLRLQNRTLETQRDALCHRIVQEGEGEEEEEEED